MILQFPWDRRWLNGVQYQYLIQNYQEYNEKRDFWILQEHPNCIYNNPSHGLIYFLHGHNLRQLGFPRVKGLRKRFKWKKMNFITPLPKQKPRVNYLVATGRLGHFCYRMHIVSCGKNYPILCHMLRIKTTFKGGVGIPSRQHFKQNQKQELISSPISEPQVENKIQQEEQKAGKIHPLYYQGFQLRLAFFRPPLAVVSSNQSGIN